MRPKNFSKMNLLYYLKIGRAVDLADPKERKIYRFFEILPGAISWLTLFLVIFLSWLKPVWMAFFIIGFVIYWLCRTIYFSFHLSACYRQMRKNEKTDWLEKLKKFDENWPKIYHLIVLPMHKESLEIIREGFISLLNSDWPKEKMIVVLTCEEKGNKKAAEMIKNEFSSKFFKFLLTFHPANLPGEIAGKGANETWGAKRTKELIIDPLKIPYEKIIYSSLDADACVFPKYFSCLTYYYLTQKNPTLCSFQPVPLFINNIWQTPPISRIFAFSASFWQMMSQERPEKLITFSSHSMSFKSLVEVGFRQTNVVSDDSRIFWQCFLRYNGDYHVVPLYYPIAMDANCAPTFLKTMKNVYKQQRRWAYGVGDVPYFLFGFYKDWQRFSFRKRAENKRIPISKKFSLGFILIEGHWSWATNSIIIFLLGWLPLTLGGHEFGQSLLAHSLPVFVRNVLTCAMLGLVGSAYFNILLLPPKPPNYGSKKYFLFILEWFLLPLIMIFFTAFPALDAQTRWMLGKYMGFWPTEKFRR